MASIRSGAGRDEPVERFNATSGRFVGSLTLVSVAVIVGYVVVDAHTLDGLRVATGALFVGVLVWLTLLRPRATAYRDVLRLQNSVRDVDVPLALVEDVHVGRMLTVWAGEERFVCVGVGAPLRELARGRKGGPGSLRGWDHLEEYSHQPTPPRQLPTASYAEFVEGQILALAEDARRRSGAQGTAQAPEPGHEWAWAGIVALAVTAVAFLVTLLL